MIDYIKKLDLSNKKVFITGACGLIGFEITTALAQYGADCIMLDINKEMGNEKATQFCEKGYSVKFEYLDITNLDEISNNIKFLSEKYNGIDIWINCAYPRTDDWGNKVENLQLDSWRKNVDMHLNSYSWICKEVALLMKEVKSGVILNFASIYGVVGSDESIYEGTDMTMPMGYAAIKGGIVNLTRYLASYFGKYNIRINSICPGGIENNQDKTFIKKYSLKTPLKRMGRPEEVASSVLFLVSDAASYVTGITLMIDGGWTAI